jgi:hypothetical protein
MPRGDPSPKLAITIDPKVHEEVLRAAARDPMERRIQGPGLNLEEVFRGPLNVFSDCVAVGRSGKKGPENQEIERASQPLNMGWRRASHCVGILPCVV